MKSNYIRFLFIFLVFSIMINTSIDYASAASKTITDNFIVVTKYEQDGAWVT